MIQRLNSLKALQEKLKLDVEEQEIYIQAMQREIDNISKKEENLNG